MRFRIHLLFLLALLASAPVFPSVGALAQSEPTGDSQLVFALVLSRHGVRSPTKDVSHYAKYAADPWPAWSVPPGYLTDHGYKQMVVMGKYYHDAFAAEGLSPAPGAVYLYADSSERTIKTGEALAEGLAGLPASAVHHLPQDTTDPIFETGKPDGDALAAIGGRIGGDTKELIDLYEPEFDLMTAALGNDAVQSKAASPGASMDSLSGPLSTASTLAEIFILEYAEGMPAGWGRLTKARIGQIDRLHTLDFELKDRTLPLARAQAADQLRRIANTLLLHASSTAAGLKASDPVYGTGDNPLVVVVGHDNQMASVGGLLHADWLARDFAWDDIPPGGGMVFELRLRAGADPKSADGYVVRVYFVSQTLDQMRNLTPLSPAGESPSISPMFIPGASLAGDPHFDCPLTAFSTVVDRAVAP